MTDFQQDCHVVIEPVNREYLKYGTFRAIGHALSYSRVSVIFVLNISKSLLSCLQRLYKHGSVSKYHRMSKKMTLPLTEEKYEHYKVFVCVTYFTQSSYSWPEIFSVSC